jgi:uncharacterized membrane protein SirB2
VSPETYAALRLLHRACALVSIAGFVLRWQAGLAGQPWVRGRAARSVPHVVDTVLLASALALAVGAGFNPLVTPWLATKIVALPVYIGLGLLALAPRRSRPVRIVAGIAAVMVFGHIAAVAMVKHPAGLAGLLVDGW